MAKVNRETIGTMPCEHCGGVRTIHETAKGAREGLLYTRCPSCPERHHKCIQKVGVAYQAEIKSKATWREGFEQYGAPVEPTPLKPETPETPGAAKGVGDLDTPATPEQPQKPKPKRSGAGVIVGLAGFLLIAIGALKQ